MNEALFAEVLKDQYGAALAMLEEAIRRCPKGAWDAGEPRPVWREARHAAYYLDFYLATSPDGFRDPKDLGPEPHSLGSASEPACDRGALLAYVERIRDRLESAVTGHSRTGFARKNTFWWTGPTTAHRLVYGLRHAQHHLGVLAEALRRHGAEPGPWIVNAPDPEEKTAG